LASIGWSGGSNGRATRPSVAFARAELIGVLEGLTTIGIWFVIVVVSLFVARRRGYLRRAVVTAGPVDG
jgi:hypothetical protein